VTFTEQTFKTLDPLPAKNDENFPKFENIFRFATKFYVISEVLEKFGDNLLAPFCENIAKKNSVPFDLENKVQG